MSLFSNVKLNIRQHFLDKIANPLSVNNVTSNSLKTLNKDVFEKSNSTNPGRNSMTSADKMNILIKNKNVRNLVKDGIFNETDLDMLIDFNEEKIEQLLNLLQNKRIMEMFYSGAMSVASLFLFSLLDDKENKKLYSLLDNKQIQKLIQDGKINAASILRIVKFDELVSNISNKPPVDESSQSADDSKGVNIFDLSAITNIRRNLYSLSSNDKFELQFCARVLKQLFDIDNLFSDDEKNEINLLDKSLVKSLKYAINPAQITKENMKNMMTGFFANNDKSLDKLLSTTDFRQFGKQGLPLSYPRKAFLNDLTKVFARVSKYKKDEIAQKLGVSFIEDGYNKIIGYDGIIDLTNLANDGVEGEVLSLANRFIKENSIITGDKKLDNALNSLIEGMPEFINVIGKQQHVTQTLSVDAHILSVLQFAMANKDYAKLSDEDKTCLKFAIVLHDIAKSEGIIDKQHPDNSALFTKNIMEKYSFSKEINDRIFEIVKNHHWLEKYNTGAYTPAYTASLFRHKNDYLMAKIMADSDLRAISDSFYDAFSYALRPEKQAPVANYISSINATGQLLFATKIIREDLIPKAIYKGKEYKVIDFTKMDKNTDLSKFGFEPGVTYDTARFFVHAGDIRDFYIAVNLSNIVNNGFLSTSCVSPGNCKTFCDMPFAISFDCEKQNIASAFYIDQYSGHKKDFSLFGKIITGEDKEFVRYRQTVPDLIKTGLNLDDNEYIELFNMLESKKYLSQISDNKIYRVGKKVLSGEKIKKAIVDAENKLSSSPLYNEINLYNPKINAFVAKVNSLDEIPEDFLNFAHEYNLPIYIFGN